MRLVNNKGFSIIEVSVTFAIFAIMMTGLFMALSVGDSSWRSNFAKMSLQQDLRRAMEEMQFELREAGATSISNVPADGTWYSTISYQIPSGITSGDLVWDTDVITLSVTNNRLQRVKGLTTKVLANDVQSVQFRRQAATSNLLEIDVQGQKTTAAGLVVDYDLDFQIGLRN